VNQMKKNFKNTMQFFQRFLGMNSDNKAQLEEEKKFITYKVVEMENKKIGFELNVRGEKKVFSPEQVMGFYLKKAKTYFEKAGMNSKEMVISVPTYASNVERQAYLDAAEIAGIKCVRLINESTATALTYGFFRKSDLDEKVERIVAFVDFGHSKLTVTFASFVKGKMKVLYTHSNRNIGARQIDFILFDILGGKFNKKFGCDPRESIRCRLRLLDSIEKMRKLLTSNKESEVNCEALLEDEDLRENFTREELEEACAPVIADFRKCLEDALAGSGKFNFILRKLEW
jgi:heat shock protein 4